MKELNKVKLNLSNIRSVLVKANRNQKISFASRRKVLKLEESKKKLKAEENQLKSPVNTSLSNIKQSVGSGGKGILESLFEFLGLLVVGIIVNALPAIKKKIEEVIKKIEEFVQPIKNLYDTAKLLLDGEDANDSEYNSKRAYIDKQIDKVNIKIEKMTRGLGPIRYYTDKIRAGLLQYKSKVGKNHDLAKKDGKEGIFDRTTNTFIEREWSPEDRSSYKAGNIILLKPSEGESAFIQVDASTRPTGPSMDIPINPEEVSRIKDDHTNKRTGVGSGAFVPGEPSKMSSKQIYLHWSGGSYFPASASYHTSITGDGKPHYMHPYTKFVNGHTWRRNSKGVAISAMSMGHQPPEPYREALSWAQTPIKNIQINSMALEVARLAMAWGWKKNDISIKNVLTHAEAAHEDGYGPGSGDRETRWDLWYLKKGGKKWSGGQILRDLAKQHFDDLKKGTINAEGENGKVVKFENITTKFQKNINAINQSMHEDEEEEEVNIIIHPINTKVTRTTPVLVPVPSP